MPEMTLSGFPVPSEGESPFAAFARPEVSPTTPPTAVEPPAAPQPTVPPPSDAPAAPPGTAPTDGGGGTTAPPPGSLAFNLRHHGFEQPVIVTDPQIARVIQSLDERARSAQSERDRITALQNQNDKLRAERDQARQPQAQPVAPPVPAPTVTPDDERRRMLRQHADDPEATLDLQFRFQREDRDAANAAVRETLQRTLQPMIEQQGRTREVERVRAERVRIAASAISFNGLSDVTPQQFVEAENALAAGAANAGHDLRDEAVRFNIRSSAVQYFAGRAARATPPPPDPRAIPLPSVPARPTGSALPDRNGTQVKPDYEATANRLVGSLFGR